jgi:two-component system OmpR family sensor kinase
LLEEGSVLDGEFAVRAFDRYTPAAAARSEGGSGLGLAIVAAIAAAHGGRASAREGPGGAIEILLPA